MLHGTFKESVTHATQDCTTLSPCKWPLHWAKVPEILWHPAFNDSLNTASWSCTHQNWSLLCIAFLVNLGVIELEKWGVSFPVALVVCPSASHDFLAKSSVERITTPSALQAVCLFLGSCCTWAPSPAAGTHFASVTETENTRMTLLVHTRQWWHCSFPWLCSVCSRSLKHYLAQTK